MSEIYQPHHLYDVMTINEAFDLSQNRLAVATHPETLSNGIIQPEIADILVEAINNPDALDHEFQDLPAGIYTNDVEPLVTEVTEPIDLTTPAPELQDAFMTIVNDQTTTEVATPIPARKPTPSAPSQTPPQPPAGLGAAEARASQAVGSFGGNRFIPSSHAKQTDSPNSKRGDVEPTLGFEPRPHYREKVSRFKRLRHAIGETAFKIEGAYYKNREKVLKVGAVAVVGVLASTAAGAAFLNRGDETESVAAKNTPASTVYHAPTSVPKTTTTIVTPNNPSPKAEIPSRPSTPEDIAFETMHNTVEAYRAAHPGATEFEIGAQALRTLEFAVAIDNAQKAQS